MAKTHVAPLKPVIIARLELSAAVLLTRLVTEVQRSRGFLNLPTHLWNDSSVTLLWIRGDPSRCKDYVSSRVAIIHVPNLRPDGILSRAAKTRLMSHLEVSHPMFSKNTRSGGVVLPG